MSTVLDRLAPDLPRAPMSYSLGDVKRRSKECSRKSEVSMPVDVRSGGSHMRTTESNIWNVEIMQNAELQRMLL